MANKNELRIQTSNLLAKEMTKREKALPSDLNTARFRQNCLTVWTETKDIEKYNPQDVVDVLIKGAVLGLDFFNKECYLIAWGGIPKFQTDYKGEKKLCRKYSIRPIRDIYAKLVREGDDFSESVRGGFQSIDFFPLPFNNGVIIGAFAIVIYADGGMDYETMSAQDIEEVRSSYSKAKDSEAWKKSPGEMYKKTVLRRLCKHVELDFETEEMAKEFAEASDFEFVDKKDSAKTKEKAPRVPIQKDEPIETKEAEFTVIEEQTDDIDE